MRSHTVKLSAMLAGALGSSLLPAQFFDLPMLPDPWMYGNVVITRQAGTSDYPPASFSHWSHRRYFTCRVCHFELGFAMEANATEITEKANQAGEYCGACHNDDIAFGHTEEHCYKCHDDGLNDTRERFAELGDFPAARFGNKINWNEALHQGLIEPRQSLLDENYEPVKFTDKLDIPAGWSMIPPAVFKHDEHELWLDCGDCHPGLFNIKKGTTEHFDMQYILEGKFCGACHLRVALPLDDCKACHRKVR